MNLLAIETATEACSVALAAGRGVHARHLEIPRAHGDRLLGMIEELFAEAGLERGDLEGLALGRGPGGFTSLRIGTGVVQGIAYGLGLQVVPVSTLATLAQGAYRSHGAQRVIAAIDARMGEIYCGTFRLGKDGLMQAVGPEAVMSPEAFVGPADEGWYGAGTGWVTHGEVLAARCGEALVAAPVHHLPDARDLLELARVAWTRGEAVPPEQAVPVYLRDRVAEKKK